MYAYDCVCLKRTLPTTSGNAASKLSYTLFTHWGGQLWSRSMNNHAKFDTHDICIVQENCSGKGFTTQKATWPDTDLDFFMQVKKLKSNVNSFFSKKKEKSYVSIIPIEYIHRKQKHYA